MVVEESGGRWGLGAQDVYFGGTGGGALAMRRGLAAVTATHALLLYGCGQTKAGSPYLCIIASCV